MKNLCLKTMFKLSLILLVVNADAYSKREELSESERAIVLNKTDTEQKQIINSAFTERFGSPPSVAGNATACVFDAVSAAGKEGAGFQEWVTAMDSILICMDQAMEASGFHTSSRSAFKNIAYELISKNETC